MCSLTVENNSQECKKHQRSNNIVMITEGPLTNWRGWRVAGGEVNGKKNFHMHTPTLTFELVLIYSDNTFPSVLSNFDGLVVNDGEEIKKKKNE